MKVGCHVLPWGMWVSKRRSYTWDGRWWKLTMGEAARQISELGYQGLDCSDGDLVPYFGSARKFGGMLNKLRLEFAGVWSTLLPRRLAKGERVYVDPSRPMSDPAQFRGLSISDIDEGEIRADLSGKKVLVRRLASMGAQVLVSGGPFMLRGDIREKHYRLVGDYLDQVGEETRMHGMKLAHHPHLGTLFQEGQDLDKLLDHTDEKVVGVCVDTAHLPAAGVDVAGFVNKHSKRVAHVHMKDLREGRFVELGAGTVNLEEIIGQLKNKGYDGWLVAELDIPSGSAYDSAAVNRRFLDRLV